MRTRRARSQLHLRYRSDRLHTFCNEPFCGGDFMTLIDEPVPTPPGHPERRIDRYLQQP
jgi:hypothetical protein